MTLDSLYIKGICYIWKKGYVLVEYYFPQSISPARLDRYLSGGWFRSGPSLFRTQVLCLEGGVFPVVNIRTPLEGYTFSKSLRKILRKNDERFRVEVGMASVDAAKESLYAQHKHRFKGFIFETLEEFLFSGEIGDLFDTWEVRVYDQLELIAVSYFDRGKGSLASLLGLFHPAYESFSVGLYTMLKEVQYGIEAGFKFYYPGYILKDFSGFDYKLRLGHQQYYNWKGKWRKMDRLSEELFALDKIQYSIENVLTHLDALGIHYQVLYYPFFAMGYLEMIEEDFLRSVIYIKLDHAKRAFDPNLQMVIEYVIEEDLFYLSWVRPNHDYVDMMNAEFSENFFKGQVVDEGMLVRDHLLCMEDSASAVVSKAVRFIHEEDTFITGSWL